MRSLLALPSIAVLGFGVNACGGVGSGTGSTSTQQSFRGPSTATSSGTGAAARRAAAGSYVRGDDDADETNKRDEDDRKIRHRGHTATGGDKRAIARLVRRYYAAAAAGDGVQGCSLIYTGLATSATLGEAAETAYPPAPNVPPLHGKSCAQIMSVLFAEDHRQLAAEASTVTVTDVRVAGEKGVALLGFGSNPERQLPIRHERGAWKIDAPLDEELP